MKKIFFLSFIFLLNCSLVFSQVAINNDGTAPNASAGLDVNFTDKGFLLPRMTIEQRNAIVSPAEGLIIYCTNCNADATGALSIFQGGLWRLFNIRCDAPDIPAAGNHIPSVTQIIWNWNEMPLAFGYKWGTTNNYNTALDLGNSTTHTESGLTCWTPYTRYVWAYNSCGQSVELTLRDTTSQIPFSPAPTEGATSANSTMIAWIWDYVPDAAGYLWSQTNDPNTAYDLGNAYNFYLEMGLNCNTSYTRYVWAYDDCGISPSTTMTHSTWSIPPGVPLAGTHIPSPAQIVWKWRQTDNAQGYKWNTTNDYNTATEMGTDTTKTESGLTCNYFYTRYIWAYNNCGHSTSTTISQSTSLDPPAAPPSSTHVPSTNGIVWNWTAVSGATGYRWSPTNNFSTAQDLGNTLTKTESDLTCNTPYSRYVWAYNGCGNSTATSLTQTTTANPDPPASGTHVPSTAQIIWNWIAVPGATGYKWSSSFNYAGAEDMGNTLTKTESGLTCNTEYSRFVWAYNSCGPSTATPIAQTTSINPDPPSAGTHVPSAFQIVWNWTAVPGATGYKWGATNDFSLAQDMGSNLTKTESGLTCNTEYSRFVWAYNGCGHSNPTSLMQTTTINPNSPSAGTHIPSTTGIVWNWNAVPGATGYKWSATNNYAGAENMGTGLTKTQTGLTCNTSYTTYVWAYNTCGNSTATTLTQTTSINPPSPSAGTHVATPAQIVWNWIAVPDATGYKWSTINNYSGAENMGTGLTKTQTGLNCNTGYTTYVWAYNSCGNSLVTTLTQTTSINPLSPTAGTHVPSANQIVWNWNPSSGATGYKWHTANNYAGAQDMGNTLTKTQTGLNCNTSYTTYVWAYDACGYSTVTILTQTTSVNPAPPSAGVHVPLSHQIIWNWVSVPGATGYKWSPNNNYSGAQDMGNTTSKTETGLNCNTSYTRYVWAYNTCGNSTSTTLTETCLIYPLPPSAGTHVPSTNQIAWNWITVPGATGYKWCATNNYGNAIDMGTGLTRTQTGLTCNTSYTTYVWAYNSCGASIETSLTQTTTINPPQPSAGTHVPSTTEIVWNWTVVPEATGYKWSAINNFSGAENMGTNLSKTETGLSCNTLYTRYVWAYNSCGQSSEFTLTQSTLQTAFSSAPVEGIHIATSSSIEWKWHPVAGATGYRWHTANDFAGATEMGTDTSHFETGLSCNTSLTRYVWAYDNCGFSTVTTLTKTTSNASPTAPVSGTHVPLSSQILWNWNTVSGASGYKWNSTDNYSTATDMGTATSNTETGLNCNTSYTRYVWAYNNCGNSTSTAITQATNDDLPEIPTAGTHTPSYTQIVWNWSAVDDAIGYKWNTTNDYNSATDMGSSTSKTETGLSCNSAYTRYAWAYNSCGQSTSVTLTQSTLTCWTCGSNLTINHVAGDVAPVDKTVTYGTVTNVPGETTKCWITSNLGADHQATSKSDATEASAGWYWQFNLMQGYKHDGTTRTPNTTWITSIVEYSDWTPAKDPCTIELGTGWRIPTTGEWDAVDAAGNWTNYNGPWNSILKMHLAGRLNNNTAAVEDRGSKGFYWSSSQTGMQSNAFCIYFNPSNCSAGSYSKAFAKPLRCLKD